MFHERQKKKENSSENKKEKISSAHTVHMKVSRHKNVALNVFVLNYSKDSDWVVYGVLVMKSI